MKVLVIFHFDEVSADSEEAEQIIASIGESCETMASGFDASGCWVQECYDDGDEDAANSPEILGEIFGDDPRDLVKSPTVVHKIG
jgi:hypothetical protein